MVDKGIEVGSYGMIKGNFSGMPSGFVQGAIVKVENIDSDEYNEYPYTVKLIDLSDWTQVAFHEAHWFDGCSAKGFEL